MALLGLKGIEKKMIETPEFIGSVTGGIRLLRKYGGATAASELGAINIWKDDAGNYRGERLYYYVVQDSIIGTQRELKKWLDKALKAIGKK